MIRRTDEEDIKLGKLGWPFDYGNENVWLFLVIVGFGSPVIIGVIFVIVKWLASAQGS